MSTNSGVIVWFLVLGGLLWASLTTRRAFDEACAAGFPAEIERATCRYGSVLEVSGKFEDFTRGALEAE